MTADDERLDEIWRTGFAMLHKALADGFASIHAELDSLFPGTFSEPADPADAATAAKSTDATV